MKDPGKMKLLPWQLMRNDEIWTLNPDPRGEITFIGSVENPEYPLDSALAQYIVDMHNAQIDKIENSSSVTYFDYEKMVAELREGA